VVPANLGSTASQNCLCGPHTLHPLPQFRAYRKVQLELFQREYASRMKSYVIELAAEVWIALKENT
jgi:hypothetical protein